MSGTEDLDQVNENVEIEKRQAVKQPLAGISEGVDQATDQAVIEEKKAVIDGLWCCDGRIVSAESSGEAIVIYQAFYREKPVVCVASTRSPDRGEKVFARDAEGNPTEQVI